MSRRSKSDGEGIRTRGVHMVAAPLDRKGAKNARMPWRPGVSAVLSSAHGSRARIGAYAALGRQLQNSTEEK